MTYICHTAENLTPMKYGKALSIAVLPVNNGKRKRERKRTERKRESMKIKSEVTNVNISVNSQTSVNLKELEFFSCLDFDEKEEILSLMKELIASRDDAGRRSINGQNKQRRSHQAEAAV